jgi:hypothetical protein
MVEPATTQPIKPTAQTLTNAKTPPKSTRHLQKQGPMWMLAPLFRPAGRERGGGE